MCTRLGSDREGKAYFRQVQKLNMKKARVKKVKGEWIKGKMRKKDSLWGFKVEFCEIMSEGEKSERKEKGRVNPRGSGKKERISIIERNIFGGEYFWEGQIWKTTIKAKDQRHCSPGTAINTELSWQLVIAVFQGNLPLTSSFLQPPTH